MIKNPNKLENLAPDNIYPIEASKSSVLIRGQDPQGFNRDVLIQIPIEYLKHKIINLYFVYLKDPLFLKQSPVTRYSKALIFRNFLSFVCDSNFDLDNPLPKSIYDKFFVYLKKTTNRTSHYHDMLVLRDPLKKYMDCKISLTESSQKIGSIGDYLANIPDVPPPESVPKKSLAMIFEKECPYSDTQLISSLRQLSCILLEVLHNTRQELIAVPEIKGSVDSLIQSGLITHPLARKFNFTRALRTVNLSKEEFAQLYKASESIANYALASSNPFIHELLLEGFFDLSNKKGFGSKEDLFKIILSNKNNDIKPPYKLKVNDEIYTGTVLSHLSARFVAGVSDIEIFLIQCLLASDSIQRSGLKRHKLSDFSVHIDSLQAQYKKQRRKAKQKTSTIPVYKRNTLIFEAYNRHVKEMQKIQGWIPSTSQGKTLYYSAVTVMRGALGFNLPSLDLLSLICKPNSYMRNHLIKETDGEVKPILWLIDKISKHNATQKGENPKSKKRVTVALNPDAINMSRKRIDDVVNVTPSKSGTNDTDDAESAEDENVSAELTGHSVATKKNIYNNRSASKEKIESMWRFGEQVGELMEADAQKVSEYLSSTNLVELDEIKKVLGIENISDNFQEMIDTLEPEQVDIWGGITISETTYIVANEITAMLLYGFIEHISTELKTLFNESEVRAREAQTQLAYLSEIFHKFPEELKQKGKEMSSEYDIGYPSLR